ncbi:MAG: UvrD-helicase domain-containing protein [Pelagibacterales bacterium]|nr:UvrD-helicase domain-containing protein [Pelagibacterales bacterium]
MISTSQNYLLNLNNQQKEAVIHTDGPLLILAGAGSGKTKVLTTRVAHLIETRKCWASQILCVTFTNKAANEMRERILKILSAQSSSLPWLGTFHSISNKILRRHAEAVGLKSNFTILDTLDQLRLIKNIIESENIDIKKILPKLVAAFIDDWKNKGHTPSEVEINNENYIKDTALKIYRIYQQRLRIMNCVDFGDLILHCVTIFKTMPEILELYHNNFKYILVDEYQDTNFIQNIWLNLLSKKNNNLCCVGDDDQSIYSWRGAEVKNILNFDKLNANTKVIKLEQNYRSTQNILDTASSLISNNEDRLGKKLWSENSKGDLIEVNCYNNGYDEAIAVADEIEKNLSKEYSLNQISILVRAAFQTREFEDRFIKINLPYRVIGGLKFYDRAEIKDAICYIRIIYQENDDLAFERIVNTPKRSIGDATLKEIHKIAKEKSINLEQASLEYCEQENSTGKTILNLKKIITDIQLWRKLSKEISHYELTERVLDESGYSQMLMTEKTPEADSKLENLKELILSMKSYSSLQDFLENISLQTSIDQDWNGEKINLMTMHAAKGLEFDVVFLPGWEEGLFPHQKSIDEKGHQGIEEERRLAYVAITRAKKKLFISFVNNRRIYGGKRDRDIDWMPTLPSRFVDELPKDNINMKNHFSEYQKNDFDFNQEIDYDKPSRSPGWERLKQAKQNKTNFNKISYSNNNTIFKVGESVNHEDFGNGKVIHIEDNKVIINFKKYGEKKIIDKFIKKSNEQN